MSQFYQFKCFFRPGVNKSTYLYARVTLGYSLLQLGQGNLRKFHEIREVFTSNTCKFWKKMGRVSDFQKTSWVQFPLSSRYIYPCPESPLSIYFDPFSYKHKHGIINKSMFHTLQIRLFLIERTLTGKSKEHVVP